VPRDSLRLQAEEAFADPAWRSALGHAVAVRAAENAPDLCRGLQGYVTTYQGRGSNQGNTQNGKSLHHQRSTDFRCYLELARFEPRPPIARFVHQRHVEPIDTGAVCRQSSRRSFAHQWRRWLIF